MPVSPVALKANGVNEPLNVEANCLTLQLAKPLKARVEAAGTTSLESGTEYMIGNVPDMELKLYLGIN